HAPRAGRPARPLVVAPLRRRGEPALGRPVEPGLEWQPRVGRAVAEERPIVHPRRADDLPRIVEALGVEGGLHLLEGMHQPGSEHLKMELAPYQPVAALPGVGPPVLPTDVALVAAERP